MKAGSRPDPTTSSEALTPEQEAVAKAAATWVHHLARTLKTCRLYDSQNPTVVRFRQELETALRRLTAEHGALVLRFSADDVLCEGVSLYPAKSRDDNLALPFFRDGIRTLTIVPEYEARELDLLIDAVLQVTGQSQETDDLVTMLWQAHLPHVTIDYVPGEADVGGGGGDTGGVPWPTSSRPEPHGAEARPLSPFTPAAGEPAGPARSDDWAVNWGTLQIETDLEQLEAVSSAEVQRFKQEFEAECRVPPATLALAIARTYLSGSAEVEERLDWSRFMPRVLRSSLECGAWSEARDTVRLLDACASPEWSKAGLAQELLQPISIASFKDRLETHDAEHVAAFIAFALELGDRGADVLAHVLAEIQNSRHQRQLSETLVEACRSNPGVLAGWLSDRRWFVVRNTLQILGAIGGREVVGMLGPLVDHADPRIRLELVGALRNVEPEHARPILVRMLEGADSRMFCAVLSQLSQRRDPAAAEMLLAYLGDPGFEQRPAEERRTIFMALSSAGGDDVLPALEAELNKGNWFSRSLETHRQEVARCIARVGTPLAKTVLERGAASRRGTVRRACEAALLRFDHE